MGENICNIYVVEKQLVSKEPYTSIIRQILSEMKGKILEQALHKRRYSNG